MYHEAERNVGAGNESDLSNTSIPLLPVSETAQILYDLIEPTFNGKIRWTRTMLDPADYGATVPTTWDEGTEPPVVHAAKTTLADGTVLTMGGDCLDKWGGEGWPILIEAPGKAAVCIYVDELVPEGQLAYALQEAFNAYESEDPDYTIEDLREEVTPLTDKFDFSAAANDVERHDIETKTALRTEDCRAAIVSWCEEHRNELDAYYEEPFSESEFQSACKANNWKRSSKVKNDIGIIREFKCPSVDEQLIIFVQTNTEDTAIVSIELATE